MTVPLSQGESLIVPFQVNGVLVQGVVVCGAVMFTEYKGISMHGSKATNSL